MFRVFDIRKYLAGILKPLVRYESTAAGYLT